MIFAANGDSLNNIHEAPWDHDTERNLTVVGTIGRVQGTRALVEAYLALQLTAQRRGQSGSRFAIGS